MSEWEVGEATPAERQFLLQRERELFPDGAALDAEWLLDRNPAGKALVLVARTRDGSIAGTRSLLPWRVLSQSAEVRVGQYTRTWTDPEFRHRGVSVAIGGELNRRSRELGYPIVFMFPSDRSIPGHRRVGNRLEIALERRQILLSARFFGSHLPAALDHPLRWMRELRLRRVRPGAFWSIAEKPGVLAESLWERRELGGGVIGVRDGSFVEWRFSAESGRTYVGWRYPATGDPRLLAFVHHAPGRRARLLDLWGTAGPEEKAAAVTALVGGVAERGAVLVEWCPPKHGDDTKVANRVGFVRRRRGVPMGLWVNRPPDTLGDLADPVSYRLTEGDSDYA
jgi:Acetyltransferase (GNAT) domain